MNVTALDIAGVRVLTPNKFCDERGTLSEAYNKIALAAMGIDVEFVQVDIRRGSPSFGRSVSVELSAERGNQVFMPKGFAHGFCTLEPDTEVVYKVSNYYAPEYDRGILWNDMDLKIDWLVAASEAAIADRDLKFPPLKDLGHYFTYGD